MIRKSLQFPLLLSLKITFCQLQNSTLDWGLYRGSPNFIKNSQQSSLQVENPTRRQPIT